MSIKTCKHCSVSFCRADDAPIPHDRCERCHGEIESLGGLEGRKDMENDPVNNPSTRQIGGDHYAKLAIQPMRYSMENGLNALQHTIIKYVTRYKDKGGIEDLRKAAHCVELLIQHEMDEAHKRDGWDQEAIKQAAFTSDLYTKSTELEEPEKLHKPISRESDEWIPSNGEEPDLPNGTLVDVRFADGKMETYCRANNWVWMQDGASDDITHYRIHQAERS